MDIIMDNIKIDESITAYRKGKPEEEVFLEEASDAELLTVIGMESELPPSEIQKMRDADPFYNI